MKYNPNKIEKKWQKKWYGSDVFAAKNNSKKEKFYVLAEFPYPSGDGLHVGHCRSYTALDIIARKKRLDGLNVLYPMGWDAFGLPTENYAIKTGVHPSVATKKNTDNFRKQMKSLGFSFDWSREINTTDPAYYKWTQWIFLKLFENGLAYKKKMAINWCPKCKIGLANEEVVGGGCERCGTKVEKKEKEQWLVKITEYADRLIKDLDLVDYPERVKIQQKEWIGRSEGAILKFQITNPKLQILISRANLTTGQANSIKQNSNNQNEFIEVFTTRADTIFGCTFLVLAPEHPSVVSLLKIKNEKSKIKNIELVEEYVKKAKNKSDLERQESKEKTGVELKGIKAINPANKKEIPVFVADYVMMNYGAGAIMAVPAHDERDYEFAKKYDLPIKEVVLPEFGEKKESSILRNSASAIITRVSDNKILVLFNRATSEYRIPSGGLEKDENHITALKREIKEETGYINLEIKEYLGQIVANFFALGRNVETMKYQKCFHVNLKNEESIPLKPDEHEDMKIEWVDPQEAIKKLDSNIHKCYESEFVKRFLQPSLCCFSGEGVIVNSDKFNGMSSEKAKDKIVKFVGGKKTVNYKLRDWIFSRQHYWGEPIPLVFCENCAVKIKNQKSKIKNNEFNKGELLNSGWVAVPENDLPVKLPNVIKYQPTDTGESPLAAMEKWVNVKCPKCGGAAKRETDTMPNWAGSNWYYLAYILADRINRKSKILNLKSKNIFTESKNILKHWLPVDWYNGGMEHTTLHLLYSRFIYKFLWDIGVVPKSVGSEPYKKRTSHGMILGQGGVKMSKSKGNIVNPESVAKQYGADAFRTYEMFMGPFEQMIPWDDKGVIGARRFLEKIYSIVFSRQKNYSSFPRKAGIVGGNNFRILLNKTIRKTGEDIETMKFNTAVSSLMVLANKFSHNPELITKEDIKNFLIILSPFAPHLAEELWEEMGLKGLACQQKWPKYDAKLIKDEEVLLIVQVNGKVRDKIKIVAGLNQKEAEEVVLWSKKVKIWIGDKEVKKIIFVQDKLINIVL